MQHTPVLLHESVEGLGIEAGDVIVDATLGAGGHSSEIARLFGDSVTLVGFDLDNNALAFASVKLKELKAKFIPIQANFRTIKESCLNNGIESINAVLFDLGISSMEIGESGRGFSFKYDEPLLMTLENPITDTTLTARDVVNQTEEHELADIIFKYGEEKFSRQIAKAISIARRKEKIETSGQLAKIIADAVPGFYRNGRINPATKTFQAIRIYVNDELGAIEEGLEKAWDILEKDGRIAVITFHSLEDRIVKNFFKEKSKDKNNAQLINKKPIIPTREEIKNNPRSRSSKLRIIKKIN